MSRNNEVQSKSSTFLSRSNGTVGRKKIEKEVIKLFRMFQTKVESHLSDAFVKKLDKTAVDKKNFMEKGEEKLRAKRLQKFLLESGI